MKKLIMDEYTTFECIGSECPDTCCTGWKVFIDEASMKKYDKIAGKFGDELRNAIVQEKDGKNLFNMNNGAFCPLLNEQKLCRIYRELGPDYMCDTCKNYPRILYSAGDILFVGLTISCPEVGRQILGRCEKQQFVFAEGDDDAGAEDVDWDCFNTMINSYTTLHEIAQERIFSIRERLSIMMICAYQIQTSLDSGRTIDGIVELFNDPEKYNGLVGQIISEKRSIADKLRYVRIFLKSFLDRASIPVLVNVFLSISEFIKNSSDVPEQEWIDAFDMFDQMVEEAEQEQLIVYYLYRHFMKEYKDAAAWKAIVQLVSFYSAYRCMTVLYYMSTKDFPDFHWRVLFVARMSRFLEHNTNISEELYVNMKKEKMDQLNYLLKLVN